MKRSLLRTLLGALALCVLWSCAAAIKGRIEGGRYISLNGGEFSVALNFEFGPSFEMQYADHTTVELDFKRDPASRGFFGFDTIEWLPLRTAPSPADFDGFAPGLIEEHVSKRFAAAGGSFKLTQSARVEGEKRPTWRFIAQGSLNGKPALWRGQVMLFGDRIAMPSHVGNVDTSPYAKAPRTDFPDTLVAWLGSVRRER